MKRLLQILTVLLAGVLPLSAQVGDSEFEALQKSEMRRYESRTRALSRTSAVKPVVDVSYYKLHIRVADARGSLSGDVTAVSTVTEQTLAAIEYDLTNTMVVDSATVNGIRASVSAASSSIRITLPAAARAGDTLTTRVYYHGRPAYTGLGSYSDSLRADGTRWIYTLSEPYGARDWWPCIDHPADKADSVDIWITCAGTLLAVSNGKLIETLTNRDGTKTFKWKHRYPVSTYLVAATVGNFTSFSDWYTYSATDSMEVVNYVLPTIGQTSKSYRVNAAMTPKMLEIFSSMFGQYPFIREKYGHAEFGWGGGMEHQTLTSLGSKAFSETTIAHELAHQWFGDLITCRTWPDLWLNEGFAQYFESVYRERRYGSQAYAASVGIRMSSAKEAVGSLSVTDTVDVNNLFNGSRVYNKGAWVLHMLRHAVGDSLFFASIRAYATDPALMFGTASTSDLRAVFERTTGRDMGWFFTEWVYGEKYPVYTVRHASVLQGAEVVTTLTIAQRTGTMNPSFFTMPVDLRFAASGRETTVTVWNDAPFQTVTVRLPFRPDTVQFDPYNWILKDATVQEGVAGIGENMLPGTFSLEQNYPNPFNPSTSVRYRLPEPAHVTIRVYDVLGREALTVVDGPQSAGSHEATMDAGTLPSGVYMYRMTARHGGVVFSETRRCVVLK